MGIFGKKESFDIETLKKKAINNEEMSPKEIKFFIKQIKTTPSDYSLTHKYETGERTQTQSKTNVSTYFSSTDKAGPIEYDARSNTWRYKRLGTIYSAKQLNSYELVNDGNTVTKGGISLGRAVVGGALFGGVGAVVGGVTGKRTSKEYVNSIQIRLDISSGGKTLHEYIDILNKKTELGSKDYREAMEKASEILILLNQID